MTTHVVHGLGIATEIPLPEPEVALPSAPDLVVAHRAGDVERRDVDAAVVLRLDHDGRVRYEAHRTLAGGWHLRAPGLFGFTVEGNCASASLAPGVDPELLSILVAGMGIAFSLAVTGHLCLHASAIEADGAAMAICAPSGCGKSSLAAHAAALGHPLVADDLLRVVVEPHGSSVYRGASEIRLRGRAAGLTPPCPGPTRRTADGRLAVAPPRTTHERLPLRVIVLPHLDRDAREVSVRLLRPAAALVSLLGCGRLAGWRDPAMVSAQFEQLASLADTVPVVGATVPWRDAGDAPVARTVVERALAAAGTRRAWR